MGPPCCTKICPPWAKALGDIMYIARARASITIAVIKTASKTDLTSQKHFSDTLKRDRASGKKYSVPMMMVIRKKLIISSFALNSLSLSIIPPEHRAIMLSFSGILGYVSTLRISFRKVYLIIEPL